MRVHGSTKQDGILPVNFVEDLGFADDAGQFIGLPFDVAILVDAIRNSHYVQTGTQVQKNSPLPSDASVAADYASNYPSRITIQRQPSI
jgi:hypothetical protein